MIIYCLLQLRPAKVLAVSLSREDLECRRQRLTAGGGEELEISEQQLDVRGTSRARRAALKRQVLLLLKPQGTLLTLVDLRQHVVGSNESLAAVLRALVSAGHIERAGRAYRVTEGGRRELDRLAGLRAPRCGEYSARLTELLAQDVLGTDEIALRLFGTSDRKARGRARSLGHYLSRTGRASVEDGLFGPPELRKVKGIEE